MPIQTESTGSHSRKMRFAEIPVLFYLIISGCQSGGHKPLLRTFTGTIQDHQNHKINLQGNLYRGASSHEMGFCHLYPYAKTLRIKAKIKSDVCVSYLVYIFYGSTEPTEIINPFFSLFYGIVWLLTCPNLDTKLLLNKKICKKQTTHHIGESIVTFHV